MKRKLLFLALIIISLSVFSQEKDFNFRFEVGGNLSNIVSYKELPVSANDFLEGKYKLGYQVGGFINFNFSRYFYASSGINFIAKGFNSKNIPLVDTNDFQLKKTNYSARLIYMQVPVQLGVMIPLKNNLDLDVLFGGYFGFAALGNESFEDENNKLVTRNFFDERYIIGSNRFDVGLKFGFAINYYSMYIATNYDWGMYKFISYEKLDPVNSVNDHKYYAKNSTISLSLGFKF